MKATAKYKQLYLFTPPLFITETIKGRIAFKGANKVLAAIFCLPLLQTMPRRRRKVCFLYTATPLSTTPFAIAHTVATIS